METIPSPWLGFLLASHLASLSLRFNGVYWSKGWWRWWCQSLGK